MAARADASAPWSQDQPRRLLIVAAEAVVGPDLREWISRRASGRPLDVWVVSPALTSSSLKHVIGDVDEAIDEAQTRLRESVAQLDRPGIEVVGYTGESDALLAVEDALRAFPAEEILVVTHPDGERRWAEEKLPEGIARQFDLPVTHLELERESQRAVARAQKSDLAEAKSEEPELDPRPYVIPRLSVLTVAALVVGIVGTVGLWILAANAPGGAGSTSGAVRTGIALLVTMINLGQIVGLMLFETVRFRRLPARAFAMVSLVGTPAAVAISALAF